MRVKWTGRGRCGESCGLYDLAGAHHDGKTRVRRQFFNGLLKNALNVEELAAVATLSPRQFSRVFTQETGVSPARAVEGLRVEAARLMIERSRHPLEVVARETGFRDRRHLREVFVRRLGVPPQSARRVARGTAA